MKKSGNYIRTFMNHRFFLDSPEDSVIDIDDIAHALANQCRWSGHTTMFYSVAQHSVLAAQNVEAGWEFEALMHDAAEAYFVDLPTPLKALLPAYKEMQKKTEKYLAEFYDLPFPMSEEVKTADRRMLVTEWNQLFTKTSIGLWVLGDKFKQPAYDIKLVPWSPRRAEEEFLNAFDEWS